MISLCCILFLFIICSPARSILLVVPEDVSTGLVGIYGFAPKIVAGTTDSRVGFGFRLGNHADFQVMYEFGPPPTRPIRTRSAPIQYRQTVRSVQIRRRPLIQFLIKAGFLRISRYDDSFENELFDEPR